nr:peptidylprolyl isomerase [Microvirga antarctica]
MIREPLFHFVIAGALLFGVQEWWSRGSQNAMPEASVRIGPGEVRWLRETFASQWRREPTSSELTDLMATLVNEELLAREARALGLDQNDTIVRRRLAQKLTFLIEDTTSIADPSEDELRRFFATRAEHHRTEAQVSFRHIFFSPGQRPNPSAEAGAALSLIAANGDARPPEGDPLPLEDEYAGVDLQTVSSLFGPDFARTVFALKPGSWSGPVKSGYGAHLVLVLRREQGEPHRFEDVRKTVMDDWRRWKANETNEAFLANLRNKYGVVVDPDAKPLLEQEPKRQAIR